MPLISARPIVNDTKKKLTWDNAAKLIGPRIVG